ncbi:GAF and ANTAR domain-containing protein [Microlunatus flavus]|uniref:GAF domain-containing protein n=1 Tax=Microlunatus flavus TaxID=1036181 RepID=A0A1H9IDZ8_9ACTN|nr:GAF and ANTAR domain-containing protein [Microlunatus flavus]SEQ72777.1 GAF domain-containing protein [Microlunatus flavus]
MSPSLLSLVSDDDSTPSTDSAPSTDSTRLAAALADLAEVMHTATGTRALLDELVAAALRLVPGAQATSIMLVERRTLASQHASSPTVDQVDAYQLELREGPGLDAVAQARPVRVPDMGQEQRWATFAPQARLLGVVSTLSLPLRTGTTVLGVLNLVSPRPAAFDDESERIGVLLAGHAAIALAHARSVDNLRRAVAGRDLIGQAKGRLMDRYGLDEERAFAVLRRVSQSTHRKLHDVARELATTGGLAALRELEDELALDRAAEAGDPDDTAAEADAAADPGDAAPGPDAAGAVASGSPDAAGDGPEPGEAATEPAHRL